MYVTNVVMLKGFYMTTLTIDEIILMWQATSRKRNHIEEFARMVEAESVKREREECKKCCTWKTGNQFVDEAIAVCYRAIDQRNETT